MNAVQKAIIPGILLTSLLLFFLNHQVNPVLTAQAATQEKNQAGKDQNQVSAMNDQCKFRDQYPDQIEPWCSLIEYTAEDQGLDPFLVAAVMLVESGGQPEVISHSGAVGLLQVMPRDGIASTFQCINGPCFTNRPTIEELKDPSFNVAYGTRMLSGLIEREGNIRSALRSYGPYDVGFEYADKVLSIYAGIKNEG
jgi:soluble lytic murein transglycosylase-like protein